MKQHLNTLYVTTPGAYLKKDGAAVAVRVDGAIKLRAPLHHLGGIVAFGSVGASPGLMAACAEAGVAISFLTEWGRFLARVSGFTPGNILLRREQYRRADDEKASMAIARVMVMAKVANARGVILRAARDHPESPGRAQLEQTARVLAPFGDELEKAASLDAIRGLEGDAAKRYFAVFNAMITAQNGDFIMDGRSRRPPLDPVNALLSFLYSMLTHDARAACESAGLDPQAGFLHRDRPGRPGLALDFVEELRAFLVDRLVLSLINRRQVQASGFRRGETGGVEMDDATRKMVLVAYQKRKQETLTHPFLGETASVGLAVHLQAMLLARYLRGELDAYPPFIVK